MLLQYEDYLWVSLADQLYKLPMGMTAENLGEMYGIRRDECDEYAHNSQTRYRLGECFLLSTSNRWL